MHGISRMILKLTICQRMPFSLLFYFYRLDLPRLTSIYFCALNQKTITRARKWCNNTIKCWCLFLCCWWCCCYCHSWARRPCVWCWGYISDGGRWKVRVGGFVAIMQIRAYNNQLNKHIEFRIMSCTHTICIQELIHVQQIPVCPNIRMLYIYIVGWRAHFGGIET